MTRRDSVRAQAQEIYCERAAEACVRGSLQKETPTLTLPLSGGGYNVVQGGGDPPSLRFGGQGTPAPDGVESGAQQENDLTAQNLTEKVQALYEGSGVPVREIAALAGVTERTIYKHARKHDWKPRYRWRPDGARPSGARDGATCGRSWQPAHGFAPAKGAGGRFIARAEAGKPFATGLKATDPAGRSRAHAACERAAQVADAAAAQADEAQRREERFRAMAAVNRALRNLANYLEERDKADWERPRHPGWPRRRLRPPRENDPVEHALRVSLDAATNWWEEVSKI